MSAGFLELLSPTDRDLVLRGSSRLAYPAGAAYRGAAPQLAMVIESGLLRIFVESEDGRQASVAYLHPGDTYAALEILPPPPANLQALNDSIVLTIDPANLTRLATENPSIAEVAIRALGNE